MFLIFVIVVNVRVDLPSSLESNSILACWACKFFFLWPTFWYWDCCPWSSEAMVDHLRVISFTPIISNPTWNAVSRQNCCFDIVRRGSCCCHCYCWFWSSGSIILLSPLAVVFVLIVVFPLNISANPTNIPPPCPHWPPIWMICGHLLVMTASPLCTADSIN